MMVAAVIQSNGVAVAVVMVVEVVAVVAVAVVMSAWGQ